MRSKVLSVSLIFVMTVLIFGCGNADKEVGVSIEQGVEEESTSGEVLSFALLNESITMECGTPFDEDVSKYVKADNIENISMKLVASPAIHEFEDLVIVGPGEEEVEFTDNVTQDTIIMKVVYEDTTPPVITFPSGDELKIYTLKLEYVNNEEWKVVKNTFDEKTPQEFDDDYICANDLTFRVNEGKIPSKDFRSAFGEEYSFFTFDDSANMRYEEIFTSSGTEEMDIQQYLSQGICEDEIVVTDPSGNVSNAKFKIKTIEDISPQERKSFDDMYVYEEGFVDNLLAEYKEENK